MTYVLSREVERKLIDIAALELMVLDELIASWIEGYWLAHEEEFEATLDGFAGLPVSG